MAQQVATKKKGTGLVNYIGEIINELKKVVWLKPREWQYLTLMVLLVAIAAGVVLGLLDYGFSSLMDKILLMGK